MTQEKEVDVVAKMFEKLKNDQSVDVEKRDRSFERLKDIIFEKPEMDKPVPGGRLAKNVDETRRSMELLRAEADKAQGRTEPIQNRSKTAPVIEQAKEITPLDKTIDRMDRLIDRQVERSVQIQNEARNRKIAPEQATILSKHSNQQMEIINRNVIRMHKVLEEQNQQKQPGQQTQQQQLKTTQQLVQQQTQQQQKLQQEELHIKTQEIYRQTLQQLDEGEQRFRDTAKSWEEIVPTEQGKALEQGYDHADNEIDKGSIQDKISEYQPKEEYEHIQNEPIRTSEEYSRELHVTERKVIEEQIQEEKTKAPQMEKPSMDDHMHQLVNRLDTISKTSKQVANQVQQKANALGQDMEQGMREFGR